MPSTHFRLVTLTCAALLGAAGCQKAELEAVKVDQVTLQVESTLLSADDGSLTVTAQAFQEGVVVLSEPISFTASGANTVGAQIVEVDEDTGIATYVFTGLRNAGSTVVTASTTAPVVIAQATVTVEPGAPSTLAFQVNEPDIDAGEVPTYDADVFDAYSNLVPGIGVVFTTTAADVVYVSGGLIEFRRAGTWDVAATVPGTSISETASVEVTPAAAASVLTTLDRSVAGTLQEVKILCEELDAYGNRRTQTFTEDTEVFTTPASTVTAVAGTDGLFVANGFSDTGAYTATCVSGALDDDDTFNVVAQTATNTVVASLSQNLVDAGATLSVTCRELDPFGATLPTPAGDFTVTLPVSPSGAVSQDATGDMNANDGITFVLGGGTDKLDALGTHTVRCARGALAPDDEDFGVVDLTAPLITQADITAATGPEGLTADASYAPGTTLTVTADASDFVGVRFLTVEVVTGPGDPSETDVFPAGTTTVTNDTLFPSVQAGAATFSTIQYRVRAEDGAGNTSTLNVSQSVTVDPALALDAAPGVTIRTYFEQLSTDPVPTGLTSDGTDFYVQRADAATGDVEDLLRLSGAVTGTSSVFANLGLPAAGARGGIVATPGAFGGRTVFHTLATPEVASVNSTSGHVTFSNNLANDPADLTFGNAGGGDRLFYLDLMGAGVSEIHRVASTGVADVFFQDTGDALAGVTALAEDPAASRILLADTGGQIHQVDGTAALTSLALTPADLPVNDARDIAFASGKILVAGGSTGAVYRVSGTTVQAEISTDFDQPIGVTARGTTVYVLDRLAGGWRVYQVTGY